MNTTVTEICPTPPPDPNPNNLERDMNKLREFIAFMCNTTPENVIINTKNNEEIVCCGESKTVTIEDINIKNGNLYQSIIIYFNETYNRILEKFGISLLKYLILQLYDVDD